MQFGDIVRNVQSMLDDIEGTYITTEYVMTFANNAYKWIYSKLRLADSDFDEQIVILPGVQAGIPDLNAYQADSGPLASLVRPRMIRWKLAGAPVTSWRRADGPLDYIRDIQQGIPALDSWSWIHYSIKLSNFSTSLDLEVSGDFLFDQITEEASSVQISIVADLCFSCKIASNIGKARGNKNWETTYGADAVDAVDDLAIAMVKANQAKTSRVARMNRRGPGQNRTSTSAGSLI
jgi:hypothetical protein